MTVAGPLWLASRSPRRRTLLTDAGIACRIRPAGIDDGRLRPGAVSPEAWVTALAYLKARWVADELADEGQRVGLVLGADTLCVHDGRVLGKPGDRAEARTMLQSMRRAEHAVVTGVCLLDLSSRADAPERWLFADAATVDWGHVDDDAIETYLDSGAWRDKAGGYNLDDRIDAGWPITCGGDPATVMGLPMQRLVPWLHRCWEPAA